MKHVEDEISESMLGIAFSQLLEQIRKQDDLIHSWTKFYLSIQAGLAIAFSFILKLNESIDNLLIVKMGFLFIPSLGIATTLFLTNIIVREHHWQGQYIVAIRKLKKSPDVFDKNPNLKKTGYIAKQFLRFRWFLIIGWGCLAIILISSQLLCSL